MNSCKRVSAAVFFCVMALNAADGMAQAKRLCSPADLAGTYKMTELRETPKAEEDAWFKEFPHHYLTFNPDQTYSFVASRHNLSKPEDLTKAVKTSTYEGMHQYDRKYSLDAAGVLNLYRDTNLDYSYRCVAEQKDPAKAPVNLILTGYSKKKTELYKLFRRWP